MTVQQGHKVLKPRSQGWALPMPPYLSSQDPYSLSEPCVSFRVQLMPPGHMTHFLREAIFPLSIPLPSPPDPSIVTRIYRPTANAKSNPL